MDHIISTTPKITLNQGGIPLEYGYLFLDWKRHQCVYCALGLGGQDICVHAELNHVSVQQTDVGDGGDLTQGSLIMTSVTFDKTVLFVESGKDNGSTTTTDLSGCTWLHASLVCGCCCYWTAIATWSQL